MDAAVIRFAVVSLLLHFAVMSHAQDSPHKGCSNTEAENRLMLQKAQELKLAILHARTSIYKTHAMADRLLTHARFQSTDNKVRVELSDIQGLQMKTATADRELVAAET